MNSFGIIDQTKPFDFNAPTPEIDTSKEKQLGSFTNTRKWREVIKYIEARKEFYQHFYPGGLPIENLDKNNRDAWWLAASIMQKEFDAFIQTIQETKNAVH